MMDKEKLKAFALKWWPVAALAIIFLFSYYIRGINTIPDRLLGYDPIYQFRFTRYLADWGTLPAWDELTYYMGRAVEFNTSPPLLWFLTVFGWWLLKGLGFSLMAIANYVSALLGAAIVIPAFLLGRELSNKWGGLLSAALVGTAPQILIRTFGASFDTDQIALLFILLTLWAGIYAIRKRTPASFCLAAGCFIGFMMSWAMFLYSWFFLIGGIMIYFLMTTVLGEHSSKDELSKPKMATRAVMAWKRSSKMIAVIIMLFVAMGIAGSILSINVVTALSYLTGFATRAESWIVNISIAELQLVDLTSIGTWMMAAGRFVTGEGMVDITLFITFIALAIFGLWQSWRQNTLNASFLIALLGIAVITTLRGIRFTEFSSALILIAVAAGWGYFMNWSKRDKFLQSFALGLGLTIMLIAAGIGLQVGQQVGPDVSPNWDNAWLWIKTSTPESSIIGTWWDPGHMIAALAERRNIGDGAHCGYQCMWNINDRITDLGKIMATSDENESVELIHKYQGTSEKAYWIASNDLIGKFQWVQYFGTGCDARTESRCPLYGMIGLEKYAYGQDGSIAARYYSNIIVLSGTPPIPIVIQGRSAAIFNEIIFYNGTTPVTAKFSDYNVTAITEQLQPLESQLKIKFVNQTSPYTIWMPSDGSYIVMIPPTLREAVFTKMFMLEGQGLEHFKEVFRNEEVKIFEVI